MFLLFNKKLGTRRAKKVGVFGNKYDFKDAIKVILSPTKYMRRIKMNKNEVIKELCKDELDVNLDDALITDLLIDYGIDSIGFMMISVLIEEKTCKTMDEEIYMLESWSELSFEKIIDMVK